MQLELPQELEDISSTKIRENIDNHRDISSLIDPVVQEYIYHKGMYLREPEFKPILRAKAIAFETRRAGTVRYWTSLETPFSTDIRTPRRS